MLNIVYRPVSDILTTLVTAVKRLGPERSQSALNAYTDNGTGWNGCAIARAYGAVGQLVSAADVWIQSLTSGPNIGMSHYSAFALAAFGLSFDELSAVIASYDGFLETKVPGARALLRTLLEEQAAKIVTPPTITTTTPPQAKQSVIMGKFDSGELTPGTVAVPALGDFAVAFFTP